jgi:hypothetical protein
MQHLTLEVVEKMLEGKISKNPNRFQEANGIVFYVGEMTDEAKSYFSARGVEFHHLNDGIYYTETVMSLPEFAQLDYVLQARQIAEEGQ